MDRPKISASLFKAGERFMGRDGMCQNRIAAEGLTTPCTTEIFGRIRQCFGPSGLS